jgi:murein DD-endopeptidase MepM/ murein hydrolase activator NlpD
MSMRKKWILILVGVLAPAFFVIAILMVLAAVIAGSNAISQYRYLQEGGTLSEEVLAYEPVVEEYCEQYGISDYVPLVLAVMQQESGGVGNDPMQSSECPANLKYPQEPNGITDPDYSIRVGVQYLASCLRAAKVEAPDDMDRISLALQGYNFGGGYISWAAERGGYTKQNAVEFSQMKAQQLGWNSYGDVDYVSHVLRYYSILALPGNGYFVCPLPYGSFTVSSGYGYRNGKLHKGIDLTAPEGTQITAAASGTVEVAEYGENGSGFGGYGKVILIRHSSTYSTLYAHCSQLLVSEGDEVKKGDVIALVGNTGDSTGPHCHFEIRVNGQAVDPLPYLKLEKGME